MTDDERWRECRAHMIRETMKTGVSRQDASILTDLSKHAFEQGFATVMRVIDAAPPHLMPPVLASTLASFVTIFREKFPAHWSAYCASPVPTGDGYVVSMPAGRAQ